LGANSASFRNGGLDLFASERFFGVEGVLVGAHQTHVGECAFALGGVSLRVIHL
jgi:hypothetical protein